MTASAHGNGLQDMIPNSAFLCRQQYLYLSKYRSRANDALCGVADHLMTSFFFQQLNVGARNWMIYTAILSSPT